MHTGTHEPLPDLPLYLIEAISSSDLLQVEGHLGCHPVRILIDGGSRGNFVSEEVVKEAGLRVNPQIQKKIVIADRKEYLATLVSACSLSIGEYRQSFDLLKAPIAFDIILGKPWLERANPDIDWLHNMITFLDDHQK